MEIETRFPDTLEGLVALERQLECEWWWLNGALHAIAQVQAEGTLGCVKAYREMQAQARIVDRRRVEIAVSVAALAKPAGARDAK